MIITLLKSTRLTWAAKNVHMYLLALTYAYFSQTIITNPLEILEGLILVSVLWGALYSLNDLTDLEVDKKDKSKINRAFIKDSIDPKIVLLFVGILGISVFCISILTLTPLFTIIILMMVINQLLYTLPPIRLKETALAPFASTATNNVLRVASCTVILGNILLVPLSVYLLMFVAGMGTYLMYKEKTKLMHGLAVIFCLLMAYILLVGDMNVIQVMIIIVPSFLATIPLYLSNFFEKEKMINLADFLYHKVVLIFYLVCILVLLF
ncbi:MAG: prenyltransferase [Methanobacteriaceae archaeon]|nr:prenyltransferase [Methanobacteriaceae archaeon]MDP2835634.1 prenyltransferase [Methanobacteriaceae archaeon]MDP3033767.1 prenyltransferase [Methanobacteriaceae archaeon]MDP3484397.1 prenyltransferase [Methanobacteriaceae archaeon]MDP3623415.1 prenyltransferase [Methanobacteriaceae archaeon]